MELEHSFKIANLVIKEDVIWHVGTFEPTEAHASFVKNTQVKCNVDEAKRRLFARVHSAGHLLDIAMTKAGRPDLKPSKGYHFAEGAYVEYIGEVGEKDRKALVDNLNIISR
jgi:Ser-tRNA(Ala) deacylase AlaX